MVLNRKNLYTFPNFTGLIYLLITAVIWLLGTNYQNNLILGLSYLLVSIFVVGILHAFANLAGISIRFVGARPAFAGEPVGCRFTLCPHHERDAGLGATAARTPPIG